MSIYFAIKKVANLATYDNLSLTNLLTLAISHLAPYSLEIVLITIPICLMLSAFTFVIVSLTIFSNSSSDNSSGKYSFKISISFCYESAKSIRL